MFDFRFRVLGVKRMRANFLSPLRGVFFYRLLSHGLRPFGRLRASCGLHSYAASRPNNRAAEMAFGWQWRRDAAPTAAETAALLFRLLQRLDHRVQGCV